MTDNASLWDRVQKTDPAFTKKFKRGGGFSGTATNATYLAKRMTEEFGPCGVGWGLNVLNEGVLQGQPLLNTGGEVIGHASVHRVHVRLWYMLDGKRGEIEHFGQTEFVGQRSDGRLFTDEEAPKKSLTDAMSKCLSLLGFAADIHLGLYDDNKYVNDLRREFAEQGQPEDDPRPGPPRNGSQRDGGPKLTIAEHTKAMLEAATLPELKKAFALAWKQYENPADPKDKTPTQLTFQGAYEDRKTALENPPAYENGDEGEPDPEPATPAATSRLRRSKSQ